jgi:hypothetical protein
MKFAERRIVQSVLQKEIGLSWIPLLIRASIRKEKVFSNTHWTAENTAEAEFAKRLSFASALYLELQRKVHKDKAFEIMKDILVPIGCNEQWEHFCTLKNEGDPMKHLTVFNDLMDKSGTPQCNCREYIRKNNDVCHFAITRCVFHDFFTEAGTPELTKLFCEVDRAFFPEAFPGLEFNRGNSWENTIAYGKDHCEFVFLRK